MNRSFVWGFLAASGLLILVGGLLILAFTGARSARASQGYDGAMGAALEAAPAPAPMIERDEEAMATDKKEAPSPKRKMMRALDGPSAVANKSLAGLGLSGKGSGGGGLGMLGGKADRDDAKPSAPPASEPEAANEAGGEGGAPTRAWFPETFLFEPLVVTDEQGRATVPVKVPDRLTSWRVLALAHSRQGAQAGAVTSFLGTLPTYVDPVVPPFLVAGDEVRLPVQLVNTTPAEVAASLSLRAENATLSSAGGAVKVPAEGSTVQYVTLKAPRPGAVGFRAALGSTDAVERTIDVHPAGRRQSVSAGGTLGAPRTLELEGPAHPIAGTEVVRLQVYPGALSLLRSELSASPGRGGVFEDGYTLLLAGRASGLLKALGAQPDTQALRDVAMLGTQRILRHARNPDVATAAALAEAALAHPENPVLSRVGERLAAQVAQRQRPDGTCQGADGWTLQRLLVATADCTAAVNAAQETDAQKHRAIAFKLRARAAFERNVGRVSDPYTAAAILATGAVDGDVAEGLRKQVLAAIEKQADGSALITLPSGVVRPDGQVPSRLEASALAALALMDVKDAPVADLGAALLGSYSPAWGWGDGRTNLTALRAVLGIFKTPVPENVKVVLTRDGKEVSAGVLDAKQLRDVMTLAVPAEGSDGKHVWGVRAEPAVAGLGFALELAAHVPWKDEPGGGLELTATLPPTLKVGQTAPIQLVASAPANTATKLTYALPAGVQADVPSLDALVGAGTVLRYETEDGAVILHLKPLAAGGSFQGTLKVVPTLAGTLHASASTFAPEARPEQARAFAPAKWSVQ
ncbi:MAG: hypothetical protein K1X89_11720 [Myxococcaceae bacterium]|nr:hypothetical protein [Myxococcaceae bacterium]